MSKLKVTLASTLTFFLILITVNAMDDTRLIISLPTAKAITREVVTEIPLTLENVLNEMIRKEIQFPEIVLRQVIWETGWLKSTGAVKHNNLFGFMKLSKEGKPVIMKFNTWQESVDYYKKWQDKRYKEGDYYAFLTKVGYAEDPNYISNLKSLRHKKNISDILASV